MVDTRLVVDSIVTSPRRAHENNVIGTMNVLAACGGEGSPVRKVVFKSSSALLRRRARRPRVLHRGAWTARTRRARRSSATSSTPSAPSREFALRHPHVTVDGAALLQRPGPGAAHLAEPALRPACGARHPGLRPALSVHPRGRSRRLPGACGAPRPRGRLQRRRRRRARAQRGRRAAGQAAGTRAAAAGDVAGGRRPAPASACASRRRRWACCATGAAWTTASSRPPATATATPRARRS